MKYLFIMTMILSALTSYAAPQWTYAFYLAGGKGFYREQNKNFLEICKGAEAAKNGKVIVFIDVEPEKGKISALNLGRGTYAFEVRSCASLTPLEIPSIGLVKGADLDSSDAANIKGFFDHVRKKYVSAKYFYDIAAHGDVLINPSLGSINPESITKALSGNRPDILALDMCYMGGIESLWEMRRTADNIIAASTTVPLPLNDYTLFLNKSGASPAETASAFVEAYRETYKGKRYPISVFALKTGEKFENFVQDFSRRTSVLSEKMDRIEKLKAGKSAKSNLYGTNADLLKVTEAIDKSVMTALKASVYSSFSINTEFTGPAVFLPADAETYEKHRGEYIKTGFAKDVSGWPAFLDILYRHK